MKLALVGAGKMATAFARGLIAERELLADEIVAADIYSPARDAFTAETGVVCEDSSIKIVKDADVILLAIKPQVAEKAILEIADYCIGKLVISIVAGIPLGKLCNWFKMGRIIRVMPNTPLMVGKGATVFTCGSDISEYDKLLTRSLFKVCGIVYELAEEQLDIATALSGSGPAYIFEFIQGLVDAAVNLGMDSHIALELMTQTVAGSAEMLRQNMGTAVELRKAVTSPGGTTEAALKIFEEKEFRKILQEVIIAAKNRSHELGL